MIIDRQKVSKSRGRIDILLFKVPIEKREKKIELFFMFDISNKVHLRCMKCLIRIIRRYVFTILLFQVSYER